MSLWTVQPFQVFPYPSLNLVWHFSCDEQIHISYRLGLHVPAPSFMHLLRCRNETALNYTGTGKAKGKRAECTTLKEINSSLAGNWSLEVIKGVLKPAEERENVCHTFHYGNQLLGAGFAFLYRSHLVAHETWCVSVVTKYSKACMLNVAIYATHTLFAGLNYDLSKH